VLQLRQEPVEFRPGGELAEIFSITMFSGAMPAAVSASCWESGFCSRVDTRAYP